MIISFWNNTTNIIPMSALRIFGIITPRITSLESHTGTGRYSGVSQDSGDGIPPRNVAIFVLIDIVMLDIYNRRASGHVTAKVESKNYGDNSIFENAERNNNFEVEKVGRKHSEILNYTGFNRIITDSDHSNYVDSNHENSN